MSDFMDDEPSLVVEPVERRVTPRGPVPGLRALLPGDSEASEIAEAGLQGVFVESEDLHRFAVGDVFAVTLTRDDASLACQVEVVRKESGARRGYALKVVHMTPEAKAAFEALRS